MRSVQSSFGLFLCVGLLSVGLCVGCAPRKSQPTQNFLPATVVVLPSPTLIPSITPIPKPLAAKVNNEGISLDEFKGELQRYQDAKSGNDSSASNTQSSHTVLEDLIDLTLLAQNAEKNGHIVTDTQFQDRIDQLSTQMGGKQSLSDWETRNHYTDEDFRTALKRSMEASWQREKIASQVSEKTDQVHVRQIFVKDENLANQIYQQLQSGADFASIARKYDPLTGGDLGWFPKHFLTQPAVEEAAFKLEPGKYTTVIKSDIGFHILQLIERDAQHILSPDARRALVGEEIRSWLDQQRSASQIDILLP